MDPSEDKIKDFKTRIKELTKKSCTFSHEKWCEILNPIIRGKANYMLLPVHAYNKVCAELAKRVGRKPKCLVVCGKTLESVDSYTRQRLRIALKHKSPKRRDGYCNRHKYDLQFFSNMGLVSGAYMNHVASGGKLTQAEFFAKRTEEKSSSFKSYIKKNYTDKGIVYYTRERLMAIQACKLRKANS